MSEYQTPPETSREEPVMGSPSDKPGRSWLWVTVIGVIICLLFAVILVSVAGLGWLAYDGMQSDNATATAGAHITLPPDGWSLTIDDRFVSRENDWEVDSFEGDYGQVDLAIEDGHYRWRVTSVTEDGILWWSYPVFDHRISDFYVSVDCRQISGDISSADYGLVFHLLSSGNFYQFVVSEDQFMNSLLNKNDEWFPLLEWESTQLVTPGETNSLAILAEGTHYQFFINGVLAHELDDDRLSGGTVGLIIDVWGENEAEFQFDNFKLYEP